MFWIFAGPALLFLIALPAFFPYRSLRLALRNCRHSNGSWSRSRARREYRHATRLLGMGLVLPLLVFALLEVGLFLFHRHVMPDTTLHELFGDNHPETSLHAPDMEDWYGALDEAEQKELEDRRQQRKPFTRKRPHQMILEHWPMHVFFLIIPSALMLWFLYRIYLPAAQSYHRGVEKRHAHYRLRAALR